MYRSSTYNKRREERVVINLDVVIGVEICILKDDDHLNSDRHVA